MIWNKIMESDRSQRILQLLAVLLIIFAIYGKSYLVFWAGILIGLSSYFSFLYMNIITRKLFYPNPKEKLRMFPGDEAPWRLSMSNHSRLPVFNAKVRLLMTNDVELTNVKPSEERRNANEYILPVSYFPKEEKSIVFNVKGVKRGVAKILSFEFQISDLLSLASVKMINDRLVQTEFIVYPTLLPVSGVEDLFKLRHGTRPIPTSLHEDHTLVVGTRDYLPGDSFQRIHWKASARMAEMQTKLYEKTVSQSWTICLNVILNPKEVARVGESELLERQISYTAYLCQYAVQHHIPFEIYINIKAMGRLPYLHLEMGEGKPHLVKALELLARVNINSIKMPMFRVLSLFNRQQIDSTVVILIGDDQTDSVLYNRWIRQGANLQKVIIDEDTAKLDRYTARRSIS
ncbi:DUF58 domain-containing protein [Pseudalkalibacillus salsuginis]|uniref:DUF58 domain-containing protein n=1 Tax=Pseudalkalibacillus salsuginis TaxID=2910972 RepID=UPI001F3C10BC|nr:DUF58 domain-containing protein [Pseudalkalibacillus salsuginis]MCF6408357.1 DUF58 domain-containing protein [Pseudalkalibacillus salsuginis]